MSFMSLCLATALALAVGFAHAAMAAGKIKVTWIGHATFEIVSPGGTTLLLDPFIVKNPKTPKAMKDLSRYKPDAILLTHSHFDHTADALAIAQASGAKVVGASDHVRSFKLAKGQGLHGNPGGKVKAGEGEVRAALGGDKRVKFMQPGETSEF